MNYRFHPEAESEFNDSVAYYEAQKTGLGIEFSEQVFSTIQRILRFPLAWTKMTKGCRRCLTKRFPFGVIYSIKEDYILIIAVMPLSRKPGYWESRTRGK
nr:type II toxin-antitoxin system RelE/ParE family toxin [Candidatus Sigynarchaeum springense]MDO8115505.1 type II toxin-antitoxin system RelE/ParE family toxin [Candidatus Sigynarchaeota archaeon]